MAYETISAYFTSKWIGALFFWIISGFQGDIYYHNATKHAKRNAWTGYILILIFLVAVVVKFII